jgi:hypothetical protein
MDNQMNNGLRNWIIVVTLVAVAVLAALWALTVIYPAPFPARRIPPLQDIPGDIEIFYVAQTVVSTINVTLLIFLIFTYVSIYRKTHSEFTIGLLIFSLAFFVRALTANPLFIAVFGFRSVGLGPFALLPEMFEFVALTILAVFEPKILRTPHSQLNGQRQIS